MRALKRDMTGDDVVKVNNLLTGLGYDIKGELYNFGMETEIAVRIFQETSNLEVDGIVGKMTMRELEHCEMRWGSNKVKVVDTLIEVNYLSQRDNEEHPNGTCGLTSLAMVLKHLGEKTTRRDQLEDELYEDITSDKAIKHFKSWFPSLQNYNPWNVHGMLVWVAEQRGYSAKFTDKATWTEISEVLRSGTPVIMSGAFTGAGHIVLLVGLAANGDLIVHDPWGDWGQGYRNKNGAYRIYGYNECNRIMKYTPFAKLAHFIRRK